MSNALICCDSFKGSLTSLEVNSTIESLLNKTKIKTYSFEFSDGGEGLLNSLKPILKNHKVLNLKTINHAHQTIEAEVLVAGDTAYLESANVVGLNMIPLTERHILNLDTQGLGILVNQLYHQGIKKFAIGLGGSGTSDYGIGFLQGLGYKFFDNKNQLIDQPLPKIAKIKSIIPTEKYNEISFLFISDVISPAVGEYGAAKVFAKQKNASPKEINFINESGKTYIQLLKQYNSRITNDTPYLGAAGGIALSLTAFFDCKFVKGAKFILEENRFADLKHKYDYIITGEGKFDFQSLQGKIVGEILEQVEGKNKVIVFTGKLDFNAEELVQLKKHQNLHVYECISQTNDPNDYLIKTNAVHNLERAVEKFISDLKRGKV